MRKLLLLIIMFVMIISLVYAIECENTWQINVPCNFTTPPLACTTYDIYNATNDLAVDDGTLTSIGGSLYYTQFDSTDSGRNVIQLCDNTTAVVDVVGYSLNVIYSEVDAIEENQATIQAQINTNITEILDRIGDPTGNSTTLWDYVWGGLTSTNEVNLLYRIWQYGWRTISGTKT